MSFEIGTFKPAKAANPWIEAAKALAKAHAENTDAEVEASITITVPAGKTQDGMRGDGSSERVKFQAAAREVGFTARYREGVEVEGTDEVRLTFTYSDLNKSRRSGDGASVEDEAPSE